MTPTAINLGASFGVGLIDGIWKNPAEKAVVVRISLGVYACCNSEPTDIAVDAGLEISTSPRS
jgi:hypothetical protein